MPTVAELALTLSLFQGKEKTQASKVRDPSDLAVLILTIAEAIVRKVPEGTPLVLLGRDTWPLVPVLRLLYKRETQYFLWSRLQGTGDWEGESYYMKKMKLSLTRAVDPSTATWWLKEVPPNSFVIDTGFAGSIMNAIRTVDKTVHWTSCLLVKSSRDYREVGVSDLDHQNLVEKIEQMEKLCSRCMGYSSRGAALFSRRRNPYGGGDSGERRRRVREVVKDNYQLLRDCGLSRSEAHRYSTFTGATPKERLGMHARERQQHYREVSYLRGRYNWSPVE